MTTCIVLYILYKLLQRAIYRYRRRPRFNIIPAIAGRIQENKVKRKRAQMEEIKRRRAAQLEQDKLNREIQKQEQNRQLAISDIARIRAEIQDLIELSKEYENALALETNTKRQLQYKSRIIAIARQANELERKIDKLYLIINEG